MNDEMRHALEKLANDESMTDNLDDAAAKALLRWAEQQILAGNNPREVQTAARLANRDDLDGADAVVAVAIAALKPRPVLVKGSGVKGQGSGDVDHIMTQSRELPHDQALTVDTDRLVALAQDNVEVVDEALEIHAERQKTELKAKGSTVAKSVLDAGSSKVRRKK